jgi:peroxiredoxin
MPGLCSRYLAPLCLSVLAWNSLLAAELLTLEGRFTPVKMEEGENSEKTFTLLVVVDGEQAWWTLHEGGRGAWPWPERFGKAPDWPTLLYDRGDGFSIVPLPEVRLAPPKELALATQWQQNGLNYRVTGEGVTGDTAYWQVAASDAYGPRRTLRVGKIDGLVQRLDERVVIGRGVDCRLAWNLAKRESLDDKALQALATGFDAVSKLREQLALPPRQRELRWNDQQLALLRDALPSVAEKVTAGPLLAIVQAAQKDSTAQESRADALAVMTRQALEKSPSRFELAGTGGEKLTVDDLKGQITVLHFWDYRDTQEEPYGQVGYLDFLARRKKGVQVYGVAVDDRLQDGGSRAAALTGARKVKSFMNLSYPVLIDDGSLLKQIGDPRGAGAKLPVWVVIGKDGKISHYHIGFYEVQRDQGLAELDGATNAP